MPAVAIPRTAVVALLVMALSSAAPALAQETPPAASPAPQAAEGEADALARLRDLEARLALGQPAARGEIEGVVTAAQTAPHASVRALAVSVLAWVEPAIASAALFAALEDTDARVRSAAAQSLLSLARRLAEEDRRRAIAKSLVLLDDPVDEVACSAVELLGVLSPTAATDAVRSRADAVSDVRYACFARVAGLPLRSVALPDLPELAAMSDDQPPAVVPVAAAASDGTWLFVGTAAAAGLVAFGALPSGFVPSRDVLTYDDDRTRVTREEVAVVSQLGSALAGAAALGGGAYALTKLAGPLDVDEAAAVAIGTGALGLAGASAPLALGLRDGPSALVMASGLTVGLLASTGLAYGLELDAQDEVLAGAAMGIGALTTGLAAFTAVPVGVAEVGNALRVDFGLGLAGVGAGVAGFGALALGGVLDVRPARSFALLAGAGAGGGAGTLLAFALVPPSDVQSRVACGIGLAAGVAGLVAGAFVPDAWLGIEPAVGSAVSLQLHDGALRFAPGVPVLVALDGPWGRGVGATLVHGRF